MLVKTACSSGRGDGIAAACTTPAMPSTSGAYVLGVPQIPGDNLVRLAGIKRDEIVGPHALA